MQKFELRRKSRFNALVLAALPMMAIAVIGADSIRALTTANPVSDSGSIIESMASSWTPSTETASWQEATSDDGLERTLRTHYIQLNEENRLTGTVSAIQKETGSTIPVASLKVKLVQRSQEIAVTTTDETGQFTTDVVAPGTYTLCISGKEGFLAYGIQVIERDVMSEELVPVPDFDAGPDNDLARSNRTHALLVSNRNLTHDEPVEITAAVIPPRHTALQEIMAGIPADVGMNAGSSGGTQINVEESVVAGGFQVTLQEDGKLVGRIAPLTSNEDKPIRLRNMNVYLLKDDEIVNQVVADEDGNFVFNDVEPDVYGFAAAGRDGFAALSFMAAEAGSELNASTGSEGAFRNVSTTTAPRAASELNVAICPPEDIPFLRREIDQLNQDPVGGLAGGPGPGFGDDGPLIGFGLGGSPGGGGFIPLGPLAEAALAAWVLTEVIDEIDDNDLNPGPVSPTTITPVIIPPGFNNANNANN